MGLYTMVPAATHRFLRDACLSLIHPFPAITVQYSRVNCEIAGI